MTVVWSARAIAHLGSLRAYIRRDNPEAAGHVADLLLAAVDRLSEFRDLGRPGRVAGTREWVVQGTPYVIAYRVRVARLEIVGVFHGHQRWPDQF